MTHFDHLRKTPWDPTFTWQATPLGAANRINIWHEDYPLRVEATQRVLEGIGMMPLRIANSLLLWIHQEIFSDQPFAGRWRDVWVRVGAHVAPAPGQIPGLMGEMEQVHVIHDLDDLVAWYTDLETVHPFQDGNGRVGGVVVAAYSQELAPERGWLAPNQ